MREQVTSTNVTKLVTERTKMPFAWILIVLPLLVAGHEYNIGKCPQFTPMEDFKWEKVGMELNKGIYFITNAYCKK